MSASATFIRPVGHLGSSLDGTVLLPGDQRFDSAPRAWNLAFDQRPAAVIFPRVRRSGGRRSWLHGQTRAARRRPGNRSQRLAPRTSDRHGAAVHRPDARHPHRPASPDRLGRGRRGLARLVQTAARHGYSAASSPAPGAPPEPVEAMPTFGSSRLRGTYFAESSRVSYLADRRGEHALAAPARHSRPGSAQSSPPSASWPMGSRQPARMIGSVSSTERAGESR
jgi:hypothetical protein